MLTQEQLTAALKAFGEAVPDGTKLHSLKVKRTVGYTDAETEPVYVFVLADSDKDVQRLSDVFNREFEALETVQGLTAPVLCDQSPTDLFAKAAVQMNEAFPPGVETATQDRADLERLYPKGGDGKSSAINTDEKIDLKTVVKDQNGTLEGLRLTARHVYVPLVIASAILVLGVAITTTTSKAVIVGLALYPPLTTAWYFSTADMVHGPKFREMRLSAKINTGLRIAGLFMSAAAFLHTIPTLF